MGQVALHQFPTANVKYKFKCRNKANWTALHLARINDEIDKFCSLRFTKDELDYLFGLGFFKESYINFLKLYQPNRDHCRAWLDDDNQLQITVEGAWFLTIFFEVPLLAIVNEVYFEGADEADGNGWESFYADGRKKLADKIVLSNAEGFSFADFGTRRRFSSAWQDEVVSILKRDAEHFVGTSNVYLAKKYDLKPIGTMAHEIFQVAQAIYPLRDFQKNILQCWIDEYQGNLGIALTDIINVEAFLKDFSLPLAKVYNGVRHDSGCPYTWAGRVIAHYEKLGIDLGTKTLIFSDGLNFNKCADLYKAYKNKINVSFGIGTNITNNFNGVVPLQIVMKVVECNGLPVLKLSDSAGKNMCENLEYVAYLKKVFNV